MAELADAGDLKSPGRRVVRVRVPPRAGCFLMHIFALEASYVVKGLVSVYEVKNKNNAFIICHGDSVYQLEDPSIRIKWIEYFNIKDNKLFWIQVEEFTVVKFYFSLKEKDFGYIRRTILKRISAGRQGDMLPYQNRIK